jgi:NADP-dependent 3-hydroxy acid dehydrogenase YdfG
MSENQVLSGKVAMITGASKGIGLAIAEQLAGMGAQLALCARDTAQLESAAVGLRKPGAKVFAMVADVTQPDQVAAFVEQARADLGPIDILVNNAGLGKFGPFHEFGEDAWDSMLDTNLKGVFLMSRAVAPEMIRRKTGHIINIASLAGKNTFRNGGIYCASKWGLMGLTGCMAEDLRGYGIRVASICPGSVATEFSDHSGQATSKLLQATDIAHAVAALLTQGPTSFISEVQMRPLEKP